MSRNDQVSRILAIISKIQASKNGVTVNELSRAFDVHPKTVRRDLEALEQAGFPLYDEDHDGKPHWRLVDGFMRFEVPFNASELMSLYFFKEFLKPLDGTGFEKPFRELIGKVESHLPDEAKTFCKTIGQTLRTRIGRHVSYKDNRAIFDCVNDAVHKRQAVRIRYFSYSSKRTAVREVQPYCVYYYDGALYLVGLDGLSQEVRTFNIERIRMAELTGRRFKVPADFNPEAHFAGSFGVFKQELESVVLVFDNSVAPFILERQWHPSQKIDMIPGGKLRLTLQVGGTREVKSWVMGFCEHVEVIEPASLREEIQKDLGRMLRVYEPAAAKRSKEG